MKTLPHSQPTGQWHLIETTERGRSDSRSLYSGFLQCCATDFLRVLMTLNGIQRQWKQRGSGLLLASISLNAALFQRLVTGYLLNVSFQPVQE